MGNGNAKTHLHNQSKRNVRVFYSEASLGMDAFIVTDKVEEVAETPPPDGNKLRFRKDVRCVRVLASQIQELPWEEDQFLSIFVEDVDEEDVCSRQIVQSLALASPGNIILYDV